ncbi:MAG: glycosyltransferase family 2 protein [Bacteroidota bacterium]
MTQSWSIGIICFNEKGTIKRVFEEVVQLLEEFGCDAEILLVDDASTDGSTELIQQIEAAHPKLVRAFYHPTNLGIGAAISNVYFNSRKENLVFVPGDGQFDVSELRPFRTFQRNEYICFYRKENQTYSLFRNILSYFNKLFNRLLLGLSLRDVNWVKVYKRELVQQMEIQSTSSIIESEICAKLNTLKVRPREIESKYQERTYGTSKGASLINMIRVGKELLQLFRLVRLFRRSIRSENHPTRLFLNVHKSGGMLL